MNVPQSSLPMPIRKPNTVLLAAFAVVAVALLPPAAAGAEPTPGTPMIYGRGETGGGSPDVRRLRMRLVQPQKAQYPGPRPVVVLLHGGGFTHGSYTGTGIMRLAALLADRGIAAASIEYRLQRSSPIPSPRVQRLLDASIRTKAALDRGSVVAAAVDDTLTALEFLRKHGRKLRINRHQIGLVGDSAGAATANHVAYVLDDHGVKRPAIRFVGSLWGTMLITPPRRPNRSPMGQIEAGEPPLFLVHGTLDKSVLCPPSHSAAMAARAEREGIETRYLELAGRGHGFGRSGFFSPDRSSGKSPADELVQFALYHLGR